MRDAIANGTTSLRVRYRLEHVDQASFDEQALASTALGRWTWNSDQDNPWTAGLEGDYVFVAGIEDFNSTTNGKSQFPIIADPEGGDLNQAFLKYTGEGLTVTAGRQRINLGTQRFVGGVAFRQNEQTYDALRVQMSRGDAMLDYSYVNNINRIFGPGDGLQPGDWYGDTHLLRGSLQTAPDQEIVAFAYLFDLSNDNGPDNSNATYGISYRGEFDLATVDVTLSRQSEWAENPLTYDAPLYTFRSDFPLGGETVLTFGYEVLGSDSGRRSVRTPLATMHARQGWTDKFLIAPPDGVGTPGSASPAISAARGSSVSTTISAPTKADGATVRNSVSISPTRSRTGSGWNSSSPGTMRTATTRIRPRSGSWSDTRCSVHALRAAIVVSSGT